ncbi:hypothetical protein [Bradyrhizobium australafricanum]|uniref:hypothetical protein n=1 Tax=Bradyrhizobium australafricanum TaxID=2821406 RepID=UPI001CE27E36|nr:hypothetical protein [Bradyrhizobium australafricanum]MCA6101217.1 hypothetical protein [Bradyrhizobium australafricanum]
MIVLHEPSHGLMTVNKHGRVLPGEASMLPWHKKRVKCEAVHSRSSRVGLAQERVADRYRRIVMPFFSSQSLSAAAATSVLSIVIVGAIAFAVVGYVEWSSGVNLTRFMSRTAADASPTLPPKGRTGCEQGNKSLPTFSLPLD